MLEGKGVYLKNFGSFMFEIIKKPKLPAQLMKADPTRPMQELNMERMSVNQFRPCFIVDGKFQQSLSRFNNKNEVDVAGSQSSAFQKGVNMLYCNATPIAGRTSLPREIAQSSIQAIFEAVADLTKTGMTLILDFGFIQIRVDNKNMSYKYAPGFVERVSKPNFSNTIKSSMGTTSSIWKTSTKSNML